MTVVREDFWTRTAAGWHVAFAVFALVTVILVVGETGLSVVERAAAVGLVLALAAWYAVTGARVLLREPDHRLGLVYLLVAVPVVITVFALTRAGSVLLFGLYPQLWSLLPTRRAIVASVLVTFAVGAVLALSDGSPGLAAVTIAVGLPVAVLLGTWITKIIDQSTERAELVRELTATRRELAAVSHDAGVLAERERLARDLHDTVAQGFTSVLLLLQAAQSELDSDARRSHLALAEATTRENLAEVRALVAAYTPVALAGATLPAALHRITERLGRELGIAATMRVSGDQHPLPPGWDVVLLRATQESLANVRKHAGASAVDVCLSYRPDHVELLVGDDGRGLGTGTLSGFGLQNLRDRVTALGGTVSLRSAAGVTVRITLPLAPS